MYGPAGSFPAGNPLGIPFVFGPSDFTYLYIARRSRSFIFAVFHHGIGGRPSPLSAVESTFTQRSSDMRCTIVRRFFPYTVPHEPRNPTFIPAIRSAGSTFPSLADQFSVWQSLHPPTIVRYSPAFSIDSA